MWHIVLRVLQVNACTAKPASLEILLHELRMMSVRMLKLTIFCQARVSCLHSCILLGDADQTANDPVTGAGLIKQVKH